MRDRFGLNYLEIQGVHVMTDEDKGCSPFEQGLLININLIMFVAKR